MKLKKIITGMILLLLMVSTISVTAVEPLKTATLGWSYPWSGSQTIGLFVVFNATEELTNETIPQVEINLWIEKENSPYFPNYSIRLWQFGVHDFDWPYFKTENWLYSGHVTDLNPITLDEPWNNLSWIVQNETIEWDVNNVSAYSDGLYYLTIALRGQVWVNGSTMDYNKTSLINTWYKGLLTFKMTYDPTIVIDAEMRHNFITITPVDELDPIVYSPIYPAPPEETTISTTIPTSTTEDTPFGYLFILAIIVVAVQHRKIRKNG